jgi:hypothetical protein
MTCRWRCSRPAGPLTEPDTSATGSDAGVVYRELARAKRKEDFFWFARSEGVAVDRLESLWQAALARAELDRAAMTAVARTNAR